MSILLHGCAGTAHTPTTQPVPLMTTETHTKVEQLVKNPETGAYEMMVVSEERVRTVRERVVYRQHADLTGNNVFYPPRTPNVHTNQGHSAGKTDWEFYALNVLIIAVNLCIISQ